jgi:LmbE family N-acetylglucosaminyl deacetylase
MRRRRLFLFGGVLAVLAVYMTTACIHNALPQDSFYHLNEAPIPGSGQRVLVFTPHPDDESIAIGGYLFNCQAAGAEVRMVLVTDGNHLGLRDTRYQEFRQAATQLGIPANELRYWGYPDGKLDRHLEELEPQVAEEIALFRPDVVVYSHPQDRHPDHAALGRAVEAVLAQNAGVNGQIRAYAYLVHYKYYPEPEMLSRQPYLLPPAPMASHNEVWDKVSLSPEAQQAKYAAIHAYHTQLRNPFLTPLFLGMERPNELLAARPIP